jgi:SagB-type dehydrogenase family enzyme
MIKSCSAYHQKTSYTRYGLKGHILDWEHPPNLYKTYPGKNGIPLLKINTLPKKNLWRLVQSRSPKKPDTDLDLNLFSQIFLLSYSITARRQYSGRDFYYRTVPSAGALYPLEIYLCAYQVSKIEPGLYHYGIRGNALTPLRIGNLSAFTAKASGISNCQSLAATLFITGNFFRSAWKYRGRAYRYVLLDAGHLTENILLALKASGAAFTLHYDFEDQKMEHLIGLDYKRESCLACIHLWTKETIPGSGEKNLASLPREIIESCRVSSNEIIYDEIAQIHQAGTKLPSASPIQSPMIQKIGVLPGAWTQFSKSEKPFREPNYCRAALYRRSRRNFTDKALSDVTFKNLLMLLFSQTDRDLPHSPAFSSPICTGFLAGNIEGWAPGYYLLDLENRKTGLVNTGFYTKKMASVCLDQDWLCHAAVHFLFMTDLATVDIRWGARGYRYAMFTAGRLGQMIYLGATAMGFGCCGIGALYDNEANALLGLNKESRLLYLVAAGPVKSIPYPGSDYSE